MKKVLIITYYWPPSGGSGVQRWLKFVKYLPAYEWEPHVFTPENPSFAIQDPSLEKDVPPDAEVIRFPIWEPYDIFFKLSGWFGQKKQATPAALASSKNKSVYQNISAWVRGNLFIPDPRRFWVKPSVKFLSDYIASNKIQTIITTGPPHSLHLIGLKLKQKFPHLRWLADFRDPWSEWGLWDSLRVSTVVRKIHRQLENRVLTHADEIITITPFYVRQFEHLGKRKVRLLTNGFDEDDFKSVHHERAGKFTIRHIGIINEKCDPKPFLKALKLAMEKNSGFASDVRLDFIGEVHNEVRSFVSEIELLKKVTHFSGNIPHDHLLKMYGSSSLLLLILTGYKDAEGYLPGKMFEYLACGLPILGIGPVSGDAGAVLKESGSGVMLDSYNENSISKTLIDYYHEWKSFKVSNYNKDYARKFSRKEITGQLARILQEPSLVTAPK
jgi:glycosyltransferase involved in cell wall biosynthesis